MEPKTEKSYPSAPLIENIDLEHRLENNLNFVKNLTTQITTIKK